MLMPSSGAEMRVSLILFKFLFNLLEAHSVLPNEPPPGQTVRASSEYHQGTDTPPNSGEKVSTDPGNDPLSGSAKQL
jgi:hypothetical protein